MLYLMWAYLIIRISMFKYFFYTILFFLLGCSTKTVVFSYVEPAESTPVVLSEQCDHVENNHCFLEAVEQYEIQPHTFTPVDIVFVLDVSGSTKDNFQKISAGFQSLISVIRHLDWRIYFTTADHGDHSYSCAADKVQKKMISPGIWQSYCPMEHAVFGPADKWQDYDGFEPKFGQFMSLQLDQKILNQEFLDSSTPFYNKVFQQTLEKDKTEPCLWPPYCQGNHEQPLRVIKSVMERNAHEGFRQNAHLIFFVVTEEPERREDKKNATKSEDILLQFSDTFGQDYIDKKMIVYGISIQDQDCLNSQDTWDASYSYELDRLVKKTYGMSIDICEDDYSLAFSKISNQLRRATNTIPLAFSPYISERVPMDIEVIDVFGNIVETEWIKNKNNNSISFSNILPAGSYINLRYYYKKEDTLTSL